MKLLLSFTFSLSFLMVSTLAYAQDSTKVSKNSGLELSIDYGKILTLISDFETKWEVGIGFRIKDRIVPNVQIGMGDLNPKNAYDNANYHSEGIYGTAGINYLLHINAKSDLYIGAKYGMSMFDDEYDYTINNSIWPVVNESQARKELTADWFSIVLGTEQELKIKNLFFGAEFNFRFLNQYDKFEPIDTYAIPGYGRTADETVPAVNLYIKYIF